MYGMSRCPVPCSYPLARIRRSPTVSPVRRQPLLPQPNATDRHHHSHHFSPLNQHRYRRPSSHVLPLYPSLAPIVVPLGFFNSIIDRLTRLGHPTLMPTRAYPIVECGPMRAHLPSLPLHLPRTIHSLNHHRYDNENYN
jgi:hypothetical protein